LKTADEVEELLIQEMRRLGHLTLGQWAIQAEERVSTELKSQDPTVRSRKKKTLKWRCLSGSGAAKQRTTSDPCPSDWESLPGDALDDWSGC
jgi:hypothetical protein